MADVKLDRVVKKYPNGQVAVRDFSLDIADGELVVFVGPSGCGKSTTLRMVAGLEDISSGTISIAGRVVNDVEPKDRDIAMVFQNYALYPHMSVYKNMALALQLRGLAKAEVDRRVRHAAGLLGIEAFLDRKPAQLSGGQRQRVAVGRAIVREPRAFLFDEPLSNLDAKMRVATRAELKALHQRLKTTTIYVTHDQEEAMTLGDRIVVMSAGLIQQVAPPLEVYRAPVNRFVAGFVGTPAMNFAEGKLMGGAGGLTFTERGQGGATILLDENRSARLASHVGREVTLGVRPQAWRIAPGADNAFRVAVSVVEPLGDAIDVHGLSAAGTRVVARLPARHSARPGDTLLLAPDPEGTHLFESGPEGRTLT